VDDEPAAMDDEVEKPVEGGEPPVADDTPAEEGATKTTTDASGNIVYEYDTSGTTFPEDDAAALPDGDQVLDQMDAAHQHLPLLAQEDEQLRPCGHRRRRQDC
jgi:hypothetical protein